MTHRTRNWLVAFVVGALVVALPGAAIAQTDSASTDGAVTDAHVSEVDEIKHRALHAIDHRLHTIARLTHRVENSATVTEEHAAKLLRDLADAAEGLKELAVKIRAAETVEELRELVPMIGDFKIKVLVKPKVNQVLASDRIVAATERLSEFSNKLEMLIERAEAAGYDVTRPERLLKRMRLNIRAAYEFGEPVADMVIDLQPEDWPDPAKETLEKGRRRLSLAVDHLRVAKYKGKKIVRWLRNLSDPAIDIGNLD
jgi:hypothetical protein